MFTVHVGPLTRKRYDQGARVLRVEAIVHNVRALRCGRSVEKLSIMLAQLQRMAIDFLNVVQAAHSSFFDDGALDTLSEPTHRGTRRLAGVDLQKPRMRSVSAAVVALAAQPGGFTTEELAAKTRALWTDRPGPYTARHAAYDLAKLRGKALVERMDKTRRYRVHPVGIRTLAGLLILREKIIKPVLAGARGLHPGRPPKTIHPLDLHDLNLQRELHRTFQTLAIAA